MEYPVTFVCRTCEQINKQLMGTHDFDGRETEFDSLTSAWEHMQEYTSKERYNHHIETIVKLELR